MFKVCFGFIWGWFNVYLRLVGVNVYRTFVLDVLRVYLGWFSVCLGFTYGLFRLV